MAFADACLDGRHFVLPVRMIGNGVVRQALVTDGSRLQAVVVAAHAPFDGRAEVLPEVETVSDLDRVRGTGAGALGVRTGAVTADDLGTGIFPQPLGQGRSITAGQQVQRLTGLAVDEDSAVMLSAAGGEVVDAQHLRNGPGRIG